MAPATSGPLLPPPITDTTPVLVSHISLPPLPSIAYAEFIPRPQQQQQQQQHKIIEFARQHIVNNTRQSTKSLLDSLLPIVRIGDEEAALWIFAIRSGVQSREHGEEGKGKEKATHTTAEELENLAFEGLQRSQSSHFTPSTLYPCSPQCAQLPTPCSSCAPATVDSSATEPPMSSSSTTLLPRVPLRPIYALFLDAVCDRLIDDICSSSNPSPVTRIDPTDLHAQTSKRTPSATRLGNGFLSAGGDTGPLWGVGWEHRPGKRPLVHTSLNVHLSPTALHIRPFPSLTTLLPMPTSCTPVTSHTPNTTPPLFTSSNIPAVTPGTPLTLAPYRTPAFYVSTHAGTSIPSSLLAQFWDALAGLGASSRPILSGSSIARSGSSSPKSKASIPTFSSVNLMQEPFILAFIPLFNPQGEPKGITALWPARLAFIDTSPSRSHLTNLPEMPGTEILLTPPRGSGTHPPAPTSPSALAPPRIQRRLIGHRALDRLNRTQRTFRVLELSSRRRVPGVPIPATAKHAAGYVESVARDREKERERANQERVRRERESKEGKASTSGPTAVPPNTSNGVTQSVQPLNGPAVAGPSQAAPRTGSSSSSVFASFFAKAAQGNIAHSFYPSPPDWNPITSTSGAGAPEQPSSDHSIPNASSSSATGAHPSSCTQSGPNASIDSQAMRDSLDLSNGINLGMGIDMNMDMEINLGDTMGMMGVNMGVDMDATGIMDTGFGSFAEAFTDDDFNFFDTAPSGAMDVTNPQDHLRHLGTDGDAVDGWLTNGLDAMNTTGNTSADIPHQLNVAGVLQPITPASVSNPAHESPLPHATDGVQVSDDDADLIPPAPDLIPSSPAKSPWSPGNPPTPSLELNAPLAPAAGKTMFEPISFGKSHRIADGKYRGTNGKFAFPYPSRTGLQSNLAPGSPSSPEPEKEDGWRLRYDAVTDPRVGVVNRLRGVKRKLPEKCAFPKSVKDRARGDEWDSLFDQDEDTDSPESSSSEEDDDMEEPDLGPHGDDDSTIHLHPSRPSTPPPAGLPLTATLLYSHFHHAHLLPLGVPMRPSYGDLVPNNDPPPTLISVPTPVSPAAALGGAAERNKSLELLAQAIAKEAVENDTWAEVWGLSTGTSSTGRAAKAGREVLQTDLRLISDLMSKVDGLKGPSPFSSLLESPISAPTSPQLNPAHANKLQLMQPPLLSVGRAGLVHHMSTTAIRFWEKEGLGPRGGAKDVVAFALFEEGDEKSALVEGWMGRVSRAYSARGFGAHVPGNAGTFEHGLVPLQFEAVRKTLPNLMSVLPPEPQHIVIYVIAPPSVCSSLKSPALRAIIMAQKRISKLAGQHDFNQDRVLIHFVPDYLVADPHSYPNTRHVGLEQFVTSVYDRLLRPTLRQTSRPFWEYNPAFDNRFHVPAFVLARKNPAQTHFEWAEWPSLNVLDRHTFLQVGYRLSECRKWLVAACIDERGEAHDVAVWGIQNQNDSQSVNMTWMVSNIWIFAKQFAQHADTEWRIVVSKLGEMDESEVEAWMSHLETVVSAQTGPPVHVSLVCAQNDMPFPFLCTSEVANPSPSATPGSGGVFTDVSSSTYTAFFPQRTPIVSPGPQDQASLVTPITTEGEGEHIPVPRPESGILPLCTTALLRVPNHADYTTVATLYIHLIYTYRSAKSTLKQTMHEVHADITRNWYELAVLTRERWRFTRLGGELPFHLAALEVMSDVLDPISSTAETKGYLGG